MALQTRRRSRQDAPLFSCVAMWLIPLRQMCRSAPIMVISVRYSDAFPAITRSDPPAVEPSFWVMSDKRDLRTEFAPCAYAQRRGITADRTRPPRRRPSAPTLPPAASRSWDRFHPPTAAVRTGAIRLERHLTAAAGTAPFHEFRSSRHVQPSMHCQRTRPAASKVPSACSSPISRRKLRHVGNRCCSGIILLPFPLR